MRISDWSSDVCSSDLLPDRGLVRGSKQQCVDAVVDEIEVAQLKAITEHLDGTAFNKLPDPDAQTSLVCINDAHAWSIGVRQKEHTRSEERSIGKEGDSRCRSRGSQSHEKKQRKTQTREKSTK